MEDISRYIHHFVRPYRDKCTHWHKQHKACNNPNGCICEKFAEVHGHIRSLIPASYRKSTIYDYVGTVETPEGDVIRTVSPEDVETIQNRLWRYLYGDTPFEEGLTRKELNALSVLDKRFQEGDCLVIHGKQRRYSKQAKAHLQHRLPVGKTLISSIVMIDAIWRRCFDSNDALTYDWMSFLKMRPLLKSYREESVEIEEAREADWLVIDDMNLISSDTSDKGANWTREKLDSFLISRIKNKKPTILVCGFDVEEVNLPSTMGEAVDKIVHAPNTSVIRVEATHSKGWRS